jgi:hypothetical protein
VYRSVLSRLLEQLSSLFMKDSPMSGFRVRIFLRSLRPSHRIIPVHSSLANSITRNYQVRFNDLAQVAFIVIMGRGLRLCKVSLHTQFGNFGAAQNDLVAHGNFTVFRTGALR